MKYNTNELGQIVLERKKRTIKDFMKDEECSWLLGLVADFSAEVLYDTSERGIRNQLDEHVTEVISTFTDFREKFDNDDIYKEFKDAGKEIIELCGKCLATEMIPYKKWYTLQILKILDKDRAKKIERNDKISGDIINPESTSIILF